MRRGFQPATLLIGLAALILSSSSSCVYYIGGCGTMARYERELPLSAPLGAGSSFSAQTRDGSITIEGSQAGECQVLATITAYARTSEQAQELAEQIDVRLEPSGGGLKVVVEKPLSLRNMSYNVSLAVKVPTETSLTLVTSDGSVRIANITGNVDTTTSDGGIDVQDIKGDARLRTSDGGITCTRLEAQTLDLHTSDGRIRLSDVTAASCTARTSDGGITLENVRGDNIDLRTSDGAIRCRNITAAKLDCHTSDGPIHIEYAPDAPKALNVSATTSDGSIHLATPAGLSAVVEASTTDGSIQTHLPITVQGKIGKSLTGTVGDGEGRVYLKTQDGSITIR